MKQKLFVLMILLVLVLSACGGGSVPATEPAAGGSQQTGQAGGGGTVVLVIPEEPAGLNRYLADAAIVSQVSDATVVGLTAPNEKGEYLPHLAADLPTLSDDNKTVTWKLRPGLKWSDASC